MNVREKYIDTFFGNLTKEELDEIHFNQYMWHAFSFEKNIADEGQQAIDSIKEKTNNNVYVFFQQSEIIIEKENITYDEIYDNIFNKNIWESDCYIVDKEFKWTFIMTHETYSSIIIDDFPVYNKYYIGPFFHEIKDR